MKTAHYYCQCRNCTKECHIDMEDGLTNYDVAVGFAKKGWHIRPSACPEHQTQEEQTAILAMTQPVIDTKIVGTFDCEPGTLVQRSLFNVSPG